MSGSGRDCFLQIGTEVVGQYGTAVAATTNLEQVEDTFAPLPEYTEDPSLFGGFSPRDLILVGLHAGGSHKFLANYEGHLQHLRAIMGGYTTAVPGGSSGVLDHIFTEGEQRSLTVRSQRGAVQAAGKIFSLPGVRFTQAVFEVKAKELCTWSFDGVAKDMLPGQSPTGSMSFPAVLPIKFNHVGSDMVGDGTGDDPPLNLQGVKITISRPQDLPIDVGSINLQEPDLSELLKVTWDFTYRYKSVSGAIAARSGALPSGALRLQLQDTPAIGSGGTFHSELEFTSLNARCTGWSAPVTGYGRIIQTATWQAFYDPAAASALTIRNRNTQAALAA